MCGTGGSRDRDRLFARLRICSICLQRKFPGFCSEVEYETIHAAVNALLLEYQIEVFSACERSRFNFALGAITARMRGLGKRVFGFDPATAELNHCRKGTLPIIRTFPGKVYAYLGKSENGHSFASMRSLRVIASKAASKAH